MNASVEDVQRIILEQMLSVDDQEADNHRDIADEWAERNGLEEGTMAMICNGMITAFDGMLQGLAQELVEDGEPLTEINGEFCVAADPLDFQQGLEMVILSAFRWGFETARQLR